MSTEQIIELEDMVDSFEAKYGPEQTDLALSEILRRRGDLRRADRAFAQQVRDQTLVALGRSWPEY